MLFSLSSYRLPWLSAEADLVTKLKEPVSFWAPDHRQGKELGKLAWVSYSCQDGLTLDVDHLGTSRLNPPVSFAFASIWGRWVMERGG